MKVKIKNDRLQPMMYSVTDRPVEIKTTSIGSAPDTIPPMSTMTIYLRENDVITLTQEGGITIKQEEEEETNG